MKKNKYPEANRRARFKKKKSRIPPFIWQSISSVRCPECWYASCQ